MCARAPSCSLQAGAATARRRTAASFRPTIGATGEVTQITLGLGAKTRDFEALQYHPNGAAWPANLRGYAIPRRRSYGAHLLNAGGERFTDSSWGRATRSPRRSSTRWRPGRASRRRTAGPPSGSTRRIPKEDAEISLRLYMLRRYRAAGIDPLEEPILTYPVLHYQNGGLVIDEHGETTVEGLYACGEIAGGTHGKNRMMGNSLLECCVRPSSRAGRREKAAA